MHEKTNWQKHSKSNGQKDHQSDDNDGRTFSNNSDDFFHISSLPFKAIIRIFYSGLKSADLEIFNLKITIIGLGWLGTPLFDHLHKNNHDVWGTYRHRASEHPQSFPLVLPSSNLTSQNLDPILQSQVLIGLIAPGKSQLLQNCYHQLLSSLPLKAHRILLASSTSVYGEHQGSVDDETKAMPSTDAGKRMLEFEESFNANYPHVHFLRLAGLIGKNRHPVQSMAGQKRQGGSSLVNLISLIDAIRAIEFLAQTPQVLPKTINIVAPYHPMKKDFYNRAAHRLGLRPVDYEKCENDPNKIIHATFLSAQGFQFFDPECQQAP